MNYLAPATLIVLALASAIAFASIHSVTISPTMPTCHNQSETCRDAWFEYGDTSGDYGIIDENE